MASRGDVVCVWKLLIVSIRVIHPFLASALATNKAAAHVSIASFAEVIEDPDLLQVRVHTLKLLILAVQAYISFCTKEHSEENMCVNLSKCS